MKYIVIIWHMLVVQSMYAQQIDNTEWCPPGATWVYSFNDKGLSIAADDYMLYQYEKDTFAYNLTLKKINLYNFSILTDNARTRTPNTYIKYYLFLERNDSVYYINQNENLELLYFFSENLGTSFVVNSNTNSISGTQYPINCDSIVYFQDQNIINALGFDTVDEKVFKYYDLTSSFNEWEYGRLYKNIGSNKCFFPVPNYSPKESCEDFVDFIGYIAEDKLEAYYDDIRGYSFNKSENQAQYIITSIGSIATSKNITIYPNPTSDFIMLSEPVDGYSIFGTTGINYEENRINTKKINISALPKGIYFLKLVKNEGHRIFKFQKN